MLYINTCKMKPHHLVSTTMSGIYRTKCIYSPVYHNLISQPAIVKQHHPCSGSEFHQLWHHRWSSRCWNGWHHKHDVGKQLGVLSYLIFATLCQKFGDQPWQSKVYLHTFSRVGGILANLSKTETRGKRGGHFTLKWYSNDTRKGKLIACKIFFSFKVCSTCFSLTTYKIKKTQSYFLEVWIMGWVWSWNVCSGFWLFTEIDKLWSNLNEAMYADIYYTSYSLYTRKSLL